MNATEEMSLEHHYGAMFSATEACLLMIYGNAETFCGYDTYQFPDYSKVVMEYVDPVRKAIRRKEVFPEDCRRAFEFGCRIASKE